jgi:hypothetical protein
MACYLAKEAHRHVVKGRVLTTRIRSLPKPQKEKALT